MFIQGVQVVTDSSFGVGEIDAYRRTTTSISRFFGGEAITAKHIVSAAHASDLQEHVEFLNSLLSSAPKDEREDVRWTFHEARLVTTDAVLELKAEFDDASFDSVLGWLQTLQPLHAEDFARKVEESRALFTDVDDSLVYAGLLVKLRYVDRLGVEEIAKAASVKQRSKFVRKLASWEWGMGIIVPKVLGVFRAHSCNEQRIAINTLLNCGTDELANIFKKSDEDIVAFTKFFPRFCLLHFLGDMQEPSGFLDDELGVEVEKFDEIFYKMKDKEAWLFGLSTERLAELSCLRTLDMVRSITAELSALIGADADHETLVA